MLQFIILNTIKILTYVIYKNVFGLKQEVYVNKLKSFAVNLFLLGKNQN